MYTRNRPKTIQKFGLVIDPSDSELLPLLSLLAVASIIYYNGGLQSRLSKSSRLDNPSGDQIDVESRLLTTAITLFPKATNRPNMIPLVSLSLAISIRRFSETLDCPNYCSHRVLSFYCVCLISSLIN